MKVNDILKDALKDPSRLDAKVKKALLSGPKSLLELADKFSLPPKMIQASVERLQEAKHNVKLGPEKSIEIETTLQPGARISVDSSDFFDGKWYKFGVLGDTHLASRYSRLDILRALYDIYEQEGITQVWHTGNIVDGECRFNKYDLVTRPGMEAQIEYLLNEYPQKKGIKTSFVVGDDHEGWWTQREGVDVGRYIASRAEDAGRNDFEYIGYMECDIDLKMSRGSAWMRIMHSGGGSAYAISYTTQKIVESYQGGEKPKILFVGHHHKFEHGYPREVHVVQTGTTQDQTPFMRKLKIQAHVGGTIVRYHQAKTGEINRFNVEWIPFYDRGFYEKTEKYRRW